MFWLFLAARVFCRLFHSICSFSVALGPSCSSSANSSSPSNACERERVRAKMAGRSLREVAEGLMYFLGCVGASMGTRDSGVRPLRVPLATLLRCVDVQVNSSYKLALRM